MCGIAGFFLKAPSQDDAQLSSIALAMAKTIAHRGPDGEGVWVDSDVGCAMAHRRLAIIDITPTGAQPMQSSCGRYVMTFNGEIYNFLDLKREIEHHSSQFEWRGSSDTEVLLAGIALWGLEETLCRAIGMFALALWDRAERRLSLARDRIGEKPLYYGLSGSDFVFASELKALRAYPRPPSEINRDAVALYLRHNYIPAPYSIYKGIFKLPPATVIHVSAQAVRQHELPEPRCYWSFDEAIRRGIESPFSGSDTDAVNALEELLGNAVARQMISDVPLGAMLSGGIDSSTIVALMQRNSQIPVKTFTIGFHEKEFNEAAHAKAVAQHLGTDHHELYVTPEQALEVIPTLPSLYDEPFGDSSQIATTLVSQLARTKVTVALSGDGGDELFGGYNRYLWAERVWDTIGWVPAPIRRIVSTSMEHIPPWVVNSAWALAKPVVPLRLRYNSVSDKFQKIADLVKTKSQSDLYLQLVSHWKDPSQIVIDGRERTAFSGWGMYSGSTLSFRHQMMRLDSLTYLPDDILVKVDRAAMSVGLETRVPMLDHRVVEFAWSLPQEMKVRGADTKWLLRQLLYRHVPQFMVERPKMGFGVPIGSWLRGPLRAWAEALLSEERLKREGLFNPAPIRQCWLDHLAGEQNWEYYLWDILMFQSWLETQLQ